MFATALIYLGTKRDRHREPQGTRKSNLETNGKKQCRTTVSNQPENPIEEYKN